MVAMASSSVADAAVKETPANGKRDKSQAKKVVLDPVEIDAKRKARAEKKEKEAREKAAKEAEAAASGMTVPMFDQNGHPLYTPRQWASVPTADGEVNVKDARKRVKVLSWNMLAQGLVRRKLFPGSDALRWKDREAGLAAELTGHNWDVGCFQEVDRLECHAETLRKSGYSHVFSKGYPQKQHGLMLAWRSSLPPGAPGSSSRAVFEKHPIAQQTFFYDDAEITPGRCASSRITRNIALFAALKFQNASGGIILATTHLFWHPMHAYERVRQSGLLVRALYQFRQRNPEWSDWETVLAGDFNDQPHSASYRLLTGMGLDDHTREEIQHSRVVHQSVDDREKRRQEGLVHSQQTNDTVAGAVATDQAATTPESLEQSNANDEDVEEEGDDEEGEGGYDDQMLKNCRPAKQCDGLLSIEEISALFGPRRSDLDLNARKASLDAQAQISPQTPTPLRSAYASAHRSLNSPSEIDNLFSTSTRGRERWDDADWKDGQSNTHSHLDGTSAGDEPMWTLYSSLFSLTLDFIFLLPRANVSGGRKYPMVTKLLRTHRTDVVRQGLPRKGVCVSDHVAIGAELEL
ncbi:unnamed protein product [Sympodiomycopsis kandeliae]